MNRIDEIFVELRKQGKRGLMPFLTAGDPDLGVTARLIEQAAEAGASVCEIGIPFSDPIADGPVIQASMTRALNGGVRVPAIFEMVRSIRDKVDLGLVAMVSYSIVNRIGDDKFISDAKAAGFDGFIFPDLPVEESSAVTDKVKNAGMICSMLIAPTTPIERAQQIARQCTGFIYLLSRAGITGERTTLPADLGRRVRKIVEVTDLPVAVGFGISNAQQVHEVVRVADAAIVGSAVMRRIEHWASERGGGEKSNANKDEFVRTVGAFMKELASGLELKSARAAVE